MLSGLYCSRVVGVWLLRNLTGPLVAQFVIESLIKNEKRFGFVEDPREIQGTLLGRSGAREQAGARPTEG